MADTVTDTILKINALVKTSTGLMDDWQLRAAIVPIYEAVRLADGLVHEMVLLSNGVHAVAKRLDDLIFSIDYN